MISDVAVVSPMKYSPASKVASVHIAKYLADRLGATLIDSASKMRMGKYRAIIIVNGIWLYCDFREQLADLCERNDRFYYIGNDYASGMFIPSFLRSALSGKTTLVAAYDNNNRCDKYHYINWNQLTFRPGHKLRPVKYDGLSYYGAFRDNRRQYFEKYFTLGFTAYDAFISASSPAAEAKFRAFAPTATYFTMPSVIDCIGMFRSSLYIEDKKTHSWYASPANRFYECLSGGTILVFDDTCRATFERARINIAPWIVSTPADVKQILSSEDALENQREKLYVGKNYRKMLDADVDEFFKREMKKI